MGHYFWEMVMASIIWFLPVDDSKLSRLRLQERKQRGKIKEFFHGHMTRINIFHTTSRTAKTHISL